MAENDDEKSAGKNHNKYRKEKPWDVEGIDHWSNDKFVDCQFYCRCNCTLLHSLPSGIMNGNLSTCQPPFWRSLPSQRSSPNIERNTFVRFIFSHCSHPKLCDQIMHTHPHAQMDQGLAVGYSGTSSSPHCLPTWPNRGQVCFDSPSCITSPTFQHDFFFQMRHI